MQWWSGYVQAQKYKAVAARTSLIYLKNRSQAMDSLWTKFTILGSGRYPLSTKIDLYYKDNTTDFDSSL